jgi:methionyl-tRNA synthetase
VLAAILEADFDHEVGKLSEEDYRSLRGELEERAVGALAALDRVASITPASPTSARALRPSLAAERRSVPPAGTAAKATPISAIAAAGRSRERPRASGAGARMTGARVDPITIDDLARIELRVGTIRHAEPHPNADRLVVLKVDLGEAGSASSSPASVRATRPKRSPAGRSSSLRTRAREIRGIESQGMILAGSDTSGIAPSLPSALSRRDRASSRTRYAIDLAPAVARRPAARIARGSPPLRRGGGRAARFLADRPGSHGPGPNDEGRARLRQRLIGCLHTGLHANQVTDFALQPLV